MVYVMYSLKINHLPLEFPIPSKDTHYVMIIFRSIKGLLKFMLSNKFMKVLFSESYCSFSRTYKKVSKPAHLSSGNMFRIFTSVR